MSPSTGSAGAPRRGQFEELTRDECLRLFETKTVGRVAFTAPSGPQIFPVNYAISNETVVFRTAAYSSLAANLNNARAAFEVDDVDDFHRAGWSVLAVGLATLVDDPDELVDLWRDDAPEPWAAGLRTLLVRITPDEITGRRVHPG
jgi:nitroimidazol reductase NimA-like FMN-containing flavoprotein (pyridoxamine 5'-phosphate oxidase superfamily)